MFYEFEYSTARPKVLDELSKRKYTIFENGNLNLNIVAFRYVDGMSDAFDDELVVVYRSASRWVIFRTPCTCDPGLYYLANPINAKGAATLAEGQYRGAYKIGLHRGEYEALVQDKPVLYWRDRDKNGRPDKDGLLETGIIGLNIHRASTSGENLRVGAYSAGCTVLQDPKAFDVLMGIARESASIYGNSFTYSMIDISGSAK